MKEQFYFKHNNSEICYPENHFLDKMKMEGLTEIEVYEADPYKSTDVFWCQIECFCGDDSSDTCGKQCPHYEPRNKKSGCCRHYSKKLYSHGEKITLKL